MQKKVLSLILALLMVVSCGMLTACSGETDSTESSDSGSTEGSTSTSVGNFTVPEGGYDGSEVTITFWHTMGANLREVLDNYIAEFNEIYPNIHIEHEQIGSYDDVRDQIQTYLTTGDQPNIAYCYSDHVAGYNIANAVITLDSLIASTESDGNGGILGLTDEQIDDFIDGYYAEGSSFGDGLMYTLPFSKSTEVLYYDKTFFEENGLSVPTTWEEMEEVCRAIKEIDPDSIPLGYDSESNWFITMCEQYGSDYTSATTDETGSHFLFANETNYEFVKMFRTWYQDGLVTTQALYGAYTSGLFTSTDGIRCYMCIGSSAGASYQKPDDGSFEVGITTIPQVDPDNPKVISQGPSVCIFKSDNEQEVIASWLFVKFLTTSVEFQAEFSMTSGYVPVLKSVADNEVYAEYTAKADGYNYVTALSAKVCLEQQDAYYTSPSFYGSSTARDQVGLLMQQCFVLPDDNLDAAIESAFAEAVAYCEENS
ncbi:MAG: extracellular solute-binding protein [Firmicutes bacterium]|nr:extracellular solute-binding protein [Bacillota bacterium]